MPHRKKASDKAPGPGTGTPFAKKRSRLARRVAHGALLAVGFTAMQFFIEDGSESKRLFDSRLVDSLRAPLTHYHE